MSIKPIETVYKGYRFRSRLEARWAVFFDALKIEWEYEPEGFELADGTRYLPDFYLPGFQAYIEIKRYSLRNTAEGKEACRKIESVRDAELGVGIIAFGDPMDCCMHVFCHDLCDSGGGHYDGRALFIEHPNTGEIMLLFPDDRRDRNFYATEGEGWNHPIPATTNRGVRRQGAWQTPNVIVARYKARQARFEHGEKPDTGGEAE